MYTPPRDTDARESEVFSYWRLVGFQAVVIYGVIAIAFATGALTIHDANFDATVVTVTAIFASSLLFMPEQPSKKFESFRHRRKKWSNAAYRFTRQWNCRRQRKLQRARSHLHGNSIRNSCRALEAFFYWAVSKAESWTYGRKRTDIWGASFRSAPACQRCLHSRRGPRFRLHFCTDIGSHSFVLTSGYPSIGDVALRGICIIAGGVAVRWYIVLFHRIPAIFVFIARLLAYCFIGAIIDIAQVVYLCSRIARLLAYCFVDAITNLAQVVCLCSIIARLLVYCFIGAIIDTAQVVGFCSIILNLGGPVPIRLACNIAKNVAKPLLGTSRCSAFWGKQPTGILRKVRGSGFRNIFLLIFIIFLLGGFLLEGNPPRNRLAAPPFHAGGAEPPAQQRYSERLARNNSLGSTLRRLNSDPSDSQNRTYVPQWPEVRDSAPVVSIADPDSPEPRSPEVEAVEAEVLDGSFAVLNVMRSLDGNGAELVGSQPGSSAQDSQATKDIEATERYFEFSAPEVDKCDDLPPSKDGSPGTVEVIEVGEENSEEPKPTSQQSSKTSARPKAKAKAGAYKWVPKVSQGGEVRGIGDAWATLDAIKLTEEWKHSCATVREVPEFIARQVQEAFYIATSRIRNMHSQNKEVELERAWKLFLLLPRMLLSRTKVKGEEGKSEFLARVRLFHRGEWVKLVQQARLPKRKKKAQRGDRVTEVDAKLRAAEKRARLGELSHARQELVGTPLAPRSMDTYYKLADPNSRPQQPRSPERLRQVCQFQPNSLVDLDYQSFISNVRSAPRGKSGGLSGMRNEHLKCLVFSPRIEDTKALFYVAQTLARAQIPDAIRKSLALARMTALDKGGGKVRGIAAGDTFRRVVAKTLAQQFAHEFDSACAPFQFALSTRAGTDCVGHALREISNQHPGKVIISLDGIGAYDHIDRAQMLESLKALPNASSLLPFVAMFYGHTSEYLWTDNDGEVWSVEQGDGGEQGDPLMPALFALGQHSALVSAHAKLETLNCEEGELEENYFRPLLFAFLDDLYVVTGREIARKAFDIVTGEVERVAGIRTNLGKLQLYSKEGGHCPPGFDDFQASRGVEEKPVWTCDAHDISKRGIVVLGSPLGTVEFCTEHAVKRMTIEQELLDWIPKLPTLQVAWLLLYYCAAQRANHLIRLLPPTLSAEYAEKHDRAILQCLETLLQAGPLSENAKRIAVLRCVNGGLGLRSARRTAQAAFWAAWADALPMLRSRIPEHANRWSEALEFAQANVAHVEFLRQLPSGLQEAELARRQLGAEGFQECPSWEDIREGVLPKNPDPSERAPGEWSRGWQFYASRVRDDRYLEFEVRPHLSPAEQALLLSQGGPFASQYLQALPTKMQLEIENALLQCLLRRRLRIPLADGLCVCPASSHGSGSTWTTAKIALDVFGDHLASCMRTGRVQRRANVLEKIWMQVFKEAGGMVVPNEKLRNMRIGVDPEDNRRVEFCVYNLTGVPLLCDVTQVSPLAQNGTPHPKCAVEAGAAFEVAVKRKNSTYREAQQNAGQVKLETLACEVGGRWNESCITWVGRLAKWKASAELPHLRRASEFAWHSRWWSILSVAAQRAFALSLIEVDCDAIKPIADFEPKLGAVLADVRYELESAVSRLPLRG